MRTAPSTLAFALLCMGRVHGHGHLVDPMPSWVNPNGDITAFCDVLEGPTLLPGGPYNLGPADNADMFAKNFKTSPYSSIRDFVTMNSPTCGACGLTTLDNGAMQQLNPAGTIQWKQGGEGFTSSHHGPCEVWCDDSLAFHDDNCALNKPTGLLNLDMNKCRSAKTLVMYWLALHSPQWQVYLNCVALSSANSGDVNSTVTSPTPTTSSATSGPRTTKAPAVTSPAPPTKSPVTVKPPATAPHPSTHPSHPTTTHRRTTRFPPQTTPFPRSSTPYPTPLSSKPSGGVAQPWHQCGGHGYTGPTTCAKGFECIQLEPKWYSQCLSHRHVPSKEYDTWEQCGGMSFTKSLTCKDGDVCYRRNDYFSQCVPL